MMLREETWKAIPGFSRYEMSPDGYGPDQQPVRRIDTGKPLAVSLGKNGYLRVKPYDDDGKQQTVDVHSLVLRTYAGARPDGMETRHLDSDPFNNRWRPGDEAETRAAGGNLIYGTKPENAADQAAAGTAKRPMVPCINHERCGGMVARHGSRCLPCAMEVGRAGAAMQRAGIDRETATRKLGYTNGAWVQTLVVRHGGGSEVWAPRRSRPHRVVATLRYRLRIGRESR